MIAARLSAPDMASGWGLRTLSAASPRFNPLSYHGGSVWPHDSAIAAANLAAAGHGDGAERIACGLIEASAAFGNRLPELFSGEQRSSGMPPLPYPAACRPQAWSAAAAVLLVRCLLGVEPHAPSKTIRLRPVWPPPFARIDVTHLHVAGQPLSLRVAEHDGVWVAEQPDGFAPAAPAGPPVDVEESDEAYVVYAEVPGVKAEDLQANFDDGVLTIRGDRKFYEEKKTETFRRVERRYGSFHRSLRLPGPVNDDKVEAAFKEGLLTVTVPKAEAAKPHRIEITQG